MTDPVSRLALARAVLISADIEEQLTARNEHGTRPLVAVLAKARREAAEALTLLVDADAENAPDLRRLQNEVRRFADLVRWLKEIVAAGLDDRFEVNDAERDELEEIVAPPGEAMTIEQIAEMQRLGLMPGNGRMDA